MERRGVGRGLVDGLMSVVKGPRRGEKSLALAVLSMVITYDRTLGEVRIRIGDHPLRGFKPLNVQSAVRTPKSKGATK